MLRLEVPVHSELHDRGFAPAVLVLTGQAELPDEGCQVRYRIEISGLAAERAGMIEGAIVERLGGRATLMLGPKEMDSILLSPDRVPGLNVLASQWGLSAEALARKAHISISAAQNALAGRRVYAKVRRAILRLIERLTVEPTIGEILHRQRHIHEFGGYLISERFGVTEEILGRWERDEEPVPERLRKGLRALLTLPYPLWPEEGRAVAVAAAARICPPGPAGVPVGAALRALRKAIPLSGKAVAREVGCNVNTVYAWERGTERPSQRYAGRLLQVLGLDKPAAGGYTEAA